MLRLNLKFVHGLIFFLLADVAWLCLFVFVLHWFSLFLILSDLMYSFPCFVMGFWIKQWNYFCDSSSGQFHFYFQECCFFSLSGLFISLSASAFWLLHFLPPVSCSTSPGPPVTFAFLSLWSGFLVMCLSYGFTGLLFLVLIICSCDFLDNDLCQW